MTTDPFETLIQQLGEALSVVLHVDRNHACALKVHHETHGPAPDRCRPGKTTDRLFYRELPPGKFLENVLAEALKANHLPDPRTGILGYLAIGNRLTLHQYYPFATLDGSKLSQISPDSSTMPKSGRMQSKMGKPAPPPSPAQNLLLAGFDELLG